MAQSAMLGECLENSKTIPMNTKRCMFTFLYEANLFLNSPYTGNASKTNSCMQ